MQFGSYQTHYIVYDLKHAKQLPLPGFLAQIRIWWVSLTKTLSLCFHSNNGFHPKFSLQRSTNSLEKSLPNDSHEL